MSRKAVLIAVIFLVSTLGLVVTPARAQPLMRIYGWGAVRVYDDGFVAVDVSGGLFFSIRGDKWMAWAYFRDPSTDELVYLKLVGLDAYGIYPSGMSSDGWWGVYVDWIYQDTFYCIFAIGDGWRSWFIAVLSGPPVDTPILVFMIEGPVMFSRVRTFMWT